MAEPVDAIEGRRLLAAGYPTPWESHDVYQSTRKDADLIVWAVNNLGDLLDALDQARAELAEAREHYADTQTVLTEAFKANRDLTEQRDRMRPVVEAAQAAADLADEFEEGIDDGGFPPEDQWLACMRANLPELLPLRDALRAAAAVRGLGGEGS